MKKEQEIVLELIKLWTPELVEEYTRLCNLDRIIIKTPKIEFDEDLEEKRIKKFREIHKARCNSEISLSSYSNGIGTITTAKCNKCNTELDVTDYDVF